VAFETKGNLLRGVWDLALKGDPDDAPVAERAWYLEVLEERDPERQLRLNARNSRVVKMRIATILAVIRDAASVDADTRALWVLIQADFSPAVRGLVRRSHVRAAARAFTPDAEIRREIVRARWPVLP
jgi:hypothetical protein